MISDKNTLKMIYINNIIYTYYIEKNICFESFCRSFNSLLTKLPLNIDIEI